MSDKARAACVIGWPVEHSRSPLIHNYWIRQLGIAGEYRREAVRPEHLADFLVGLAERGYVGAGVTLPHKEAALALSSPDKGAKAIGAANTLWLDGSILRSTNTDVEGFLANLDEMVPHWGRGLQRAMVLGAGGAARAVIYGLIMRGIPRIEVLNRNFSRAQKLHDFFGPTVFPTSWEKMDELLGQADLVVNTTSLGMRGQPALDLDIDKLSPSAIVADIVYTPFVTPLIAAARQRGLRHADGLGMLLHQAVDGFSHWFGVKPQVTAELRSLVEADLVKT